MVLSQIAAEALSILPERSGLILVYAGCGALGGLAAGLLRYLSAFPAISELAMRAIVGFVVGLACGAACLWKFGSEDSAVWLSMFSCIVGGFSGPAAAFSLWQRITGVGSNTGNQPGKSPGDTK